MRIAVISDVHGNLPALEAVLRDIDRRNADEIWCLGDIAFKGPAPAECVRVLRERGVVCILGNTDIELLTVAASHLSGESSLVGSSYSHMTPPPTGSLPYYQWHVERMATAELEYLARLPSSLGRQVGGYSFLLSHAAPDHATRALFHPEQMDGFAERLDQAEARFVLVGHTHRASVVCLSGKTMVNPGAVGYSLDMDWRAAYALIEPATGTISIVRVEYDIEAAEKMAKGRRYCFSPTWYAEAMRKGWWEPIPWHERAATIDRW